MFQAKGGYLSQIRFMHFYQAVLFLLGTLPLYSQAQSTISIKKDRSGYVTIWNGVCGIAVPSSQQLAQAKELPAPIQYFMLADGQATDSSTNLLQSTRKPLSASSEILTFKDSVVIKSRYLFPEKHFYTSTIVVRKNSPSIIIEEDSNEDVSYKLQVGKKGQFNQARYRGWSSTGVDMGYGPPGQPYTDENKRQPMDATVDLPPDREIRFPLLSNWDPAGGEVNTGRYWQLYHATADKNAPMFGFYQGKPSRLIGNKFAGVRLTTGSQQNNTSGCLFLEMSIEKRGPDNSFFPRKRFQWCAYITRKNNLRPATEYQPIGQEMNRQSGVGDLVEAYAGKPLKLNESFRKGSLYLDEKSVQQMIARVRTDASYYNYLVQINPTFKPSLDMWRYKDSAQSLKRTLLQTFIAVKRELIEGDGSHAYYYKYWMGSINYKRAAMQITALFADKSIALTAAENEQLEAFLRLMARIQWNNDYVPFFDSSGINYGTENMWYQYRNNGRNFFAMIFNQDPEFRDRAANVLRETRNDLLGAIRENGITSASPHYTQATLDPILYNMLQLKRAGIGDLFREHKDRLVQFIDFYKTLLTPASVRFSGFRKLVSIGDGSEESAPTFGLLAAGFHDIDEPLSNDLYYIFEHGARKQSLFGELGLSVDMSNHPGSYSGGSASFPGYLSHARAGVNTPLETAAWIINGETYSDHRNDDRGEVILYALGAPLSLSRSSFYSPRAADARIRSTMIPAEMFPSWNAGRQPLNGEDKKGNPWQSSTLLSYAKSPFVTLSHSAMSGNKITWVRQFALIHVVPEEPILVFLDSANSNARMVWNMPFTSEGISLNNQKLQEPQRAVFDEVKKESPHSGAESALKAGWNTFNVTGQRWPTHHTGGINWDLHSFTSGNASFTLSQWTNVWQNEQEKEEFRKTNNRAYEESQQYVRIGIQQPFFGLIVPYVKTDSGSRLKPRFLRDRTLILENAKRSYRISSQFVDINNGKERILAVFSSMPVSLGDITIAGGAVSIKLGTDSVHVYVADGGEKRIINFPFPLTPAEPRSQRVTMRDNGKTMEIQPAGDFNILSSEPGYRILSFRRK